MPTESLGGQKYFITFTDDYSCHCFVYFMKHQSEVLSKFKEFEAITTTECGLKIGALRTDNGGEYISIELKEYLKHKGIRHDLTVPYNPEQNGVSERLNHTLMEAARSMISHAGLPSNYWGEVVATAVYVRNHAATTATNTTPYERWYGKKPDLTNLRVFGCISYAYVPSAIRQKLDKKAEKMRFVRYSGQPRGYRLLNEKTGKVFVRSDVIFNETDFGKCGEPDIVESEDTVVVEDSREESDGVSQSESAHQRPTQQTIDPLLDVVLMSTLTQHLVP